MDEFLARLGALSLGGAGAILLLWAVTRVTRGRYAARWRCWAWLVLCLRLAVPLPPPAFLPAQSAAPVQISVPADRVLYQPQAPRTEGGAGAAPSQPAAPGVPASDADTPAPASRGITLVALLFVLWLAGAAAVLGRSLWSHLRFCRWIRRWARPVAQPEVIAAFNRAGDWLKLNRRPRLAACPGLETPMLAGLFRPSLLLPPGETGGETLSCSLLHELTHFRRHDILFKTLALWVGVLHWFNPAVWLMVRMVERDIELACDDAVLRRLSPEGYAVYGETILQAAGRLRETP